MEPDKMQAWMWEFLWFKYPNARTSERNQALAQDTDFETHEARAFRAGWDAAVHVASTRLQTTFNEM